MSRATGLVGALRASRPTSDVALAALHDDSRLSRSGPRRLRLGGVVRFGFVALDLDSTVATIFFVGVRVSSPPSSIFARFLRVGVFPRLSSSSPSSSTNDLDSPPSIPKSLSRSLPRFSGVTITGIVVIIVVVVVVVVVVPFALTSVGFSCVCSPSYVTLNTGVFGPVVPSSPFSATPRDAVSFLAPSTNSVFFLAGHPLSVHL